MRSTQRCLIGIMSLVLLIATDAIAQPCTELAALETSVTAAKKVVADDDVEIGKLKAGVLPPKPAGDKEQLADAQVARAQLATANVVLARFDASPSGARLVKLNGENTNYQQQIDDGAKAEAAVQANQAGIQDVQVKAAALTKLNEELADLDKRRGPPAIETLYKAKKAEVDAAQKAYDDKRDEVYTHAGVKAINQAATAAAAQALIATELANLVAKRKPLAEDVTTKQTEADKYKALGDDAAVAQKLKAITDWELIRDNAGQAVRNKEAEKATHVKAVTDAENALNTRRTALQAQATTEVDACRLDADIPHSISGVQSKQRYDREWHIAQYETLFKEEPRDKPQLYDTPAKAAARRAEMDRERTAKVVAGFEKCKTDEVARLEATRRHLTLPCITIEQQMTDDINLAIAAVVALRADVGGVENPFAPLPPLGGGAGGVAGGDAGGPAKPGTAKFDVKPGGWTSTGIKMTKGQSVQITAEGKLTGENNWSTGPGGYYWLGFQAWTLKAKIGTNDILDVGAQGSPSARADGELLLAMSGTYEPAAVDAKLGGVIHVTVSGTAVGDAKGGGTFTPAGPAPGEPVKPGTLPGGPFKNTGDKEFIVACPVILSLKDADGRTAMMDAAGTIVNGIPGLTLEATPDNAGGHQWYAALPKGNFVATITGIAKGEFRARIKKRGEGEFAYPAVQTDKGQTTTIQLTDDPKPSPLRTGNGTEVAAVPVAEGTGTGGTGTGTGAGTGNAGTGSVTEGITVASPFLRVSSVVTFKRITNFPRGEEAHFIGPHKLSADGSRIVFASNKGLFTINPDGSGLRQIAAGQISKLDISADGRKVAWWQSTPARAVFAADSDGGNKVQMPGVDNTPVNAMRLSANGANLFIIAPEKDGIMFLPTDGSDLKRIVDTTTVCKLYGIDPNANHWRDLMDLSADGNRIVFYFLWDAFGVNADGSALHQITKYLKKGAGMYGLSISRDGSTVSHHWSGNEQPGLIFTDFSGAPLGRFDKRGEYADSLQLSEDGATAILSPGVRFYGRDGKTHFDPTDCGPNLWARNAPLSMDSKLRIGCFRIDGPESTDQGRPNQLVVVEINPQKLTAGVPGLTELAARPKFLLADGSSNLTLTLKAAANEPQSVGAALVRAGARPPNMANMFYAMNDNAQAGDATKEDTVFTTDACTARTYDGKPLPPGPITLRLHALDKDWNLTVVDLEGLEIRQP